MEELFKDYDVVYMPGSSGSVPNIVENGVQRYPTHEEFMWLFDHNKPSKIPKSVVEQSKVKQ